MDASIEKLLLEKSYMCLRSRSAFQIIYATYACTHKKKGAVKVTYSLKLVLCVCIYMSICHMYVGAGCQKTVLGTVEL